MKTKNTRHRRVVKKRTVRRVLTPAERFIRDWRSGTYVQHYALSFKPGRSGPSGKPIEAGAVVGATYFLDPDGKPRHFHRVSTCASAQTAALEASAPLIAVNRVRKKILDGDGRSYGRFDPKPCPQCVLRRVSLLTESGGHPRGFKPSRRMPVPIHAKMDPKMRKVICHKCRMRFFIPKGLMDALITCPSPNCQETQHPILAP